MIKEVGLDTIMERVPDNYLRAIFSMGIASKFIYQYGEVDSPYFFYKFMEEVQREANQHAGGVAQKGYQDKVE